MYKEIFESNVVKRVMVWNDFPSEKNEVIIVIID